MTLIFKQTRWTSTPGKRALLKQAMAKLLWVPTEISGIPRGVDLPGIISVARLVMDWQKNEPELIGVRSADEERYYIWTGALDLIATA
jgi:hypothetical protein